MAKRIAVLAVATALGLVACGGDSEEKNDYVDRVNKAQETFVAEVDKISVAAGGENLGAVSRALDGLASQIDRLVRQLGGIDPPDEVATSHQQLERSLKTYSASLRDQTRRLGSKDERRLARAATALQTATTRVGTEFDSAIRDINRELKN